MGAGALQPLCEPWGLVLELVWLNWPQRLQHATGRTQRCPKALGQVTQRLTLGHSPGRGSPLKVIGGHPLGVHGVGRGGRPVPLPPLLPPLPRDECDGGAHFGSHARGLRETLQAALAELCMRGDGTERVDVALDLPGHALAVAPYPARPVDTMVGRAEATATRGDQRARSGEARVFLAGDGHVLGNLLQAHGRLWRTSRTTLWRRVEVLWRLLQPLFCCRQCLGRSPLCGGHRGRDRLAQCMLDMEHSGRVMRPEGLGSLRQQAWRLIAGRWAPLAVETCKGGLHTRLPGIVLPGLRGVLPQDIVAYRLPPPRHRPPVHVSSCVSVMSRAGLSGAKRWRSS